MFVWLFFAVLIAPFLYTYLFGDLIYGVGKVYAGEVQPTRDSKWMSKKSWSLVGIVFLYAHVVMGTCIGAFYCIAYLFQAVDEIPGWDDWNSTYQYTKSQIILTMILYTLGFMLVIPFVGMLLVAFLVLLFEHGGSCKRLYKLCKENFSFLYTKFLGYILCMLLLLALTFQITYTISHVDTFLPALLKDSVVVYMIVFAMVCVYWWNSILMFPTITTM